jgi:hypothetical protein
VNRCMEWFEKKETEKIVGSVGAGNEGVLEFYKSFGLLARAMHRGRLTREGAFRAKCLD